MLEGESPDTQEQAWLLEPTREASRESSVWEEGQKLRDGPGLRESD